MCKGLSSIGMPKEIGNLVNLKEALLIEWPSTIPDEFGQLTQLEILYMERIAYYPSQSFGALKSLKHLDMECNQFTSPDTLLTLTQLEVLDMCESSISMVPDAIASMTSLRSLNYPIQRFHHKTKSTCDNCCPIDILKS